VDDDAWKKVKEEVYAGFSIGGRKTSTQDNTVTALQLTEISLVDRPANPECVIELAKVAAREDTSPKEGEHKYGDVKFADAKNKKYPIDTEAHIRAAWNYINKEKNAGKYSAEDLKTIKSHIVAAWKSKIDKDGPPAAGEKADEAGEIKKGMYTVACLAQLIDQLDMLHDSTEFEAEREGDASPIPDELKAACASLCAVLRGMVAEETAEIEADKEAVAKTERVLPTTSPGVLATAEDGVAARDQGARSSSPAESSPEIAKAGARHSKADMERVQAIHDNSAGLGADCGAGKADAGGELAKATEILTKVHNDLAKANESLAKVVAENDTLKKRVVELGKLPAAPKGALKAIEKADDVTRAEEKKDEEPKTPLEAIKKAHQNPTVLKVR
jgi:hypothetical protein